MDAKVPERGYRKSVLYVIKVVWANKQYPRHFVAGREIQASKTYSQHYMPLWSSTWGLHWASQASPATGNWSTPTVHRICAPRRRQRAKAEVALERHPAARGAACRRVLPGSRITAPPLPPSPFLSGCTRPNPTTETTKWLPAASSRDPFVPFGFPNSVGPGYKWPGSAGGLSGDPAGPWRLGVEAGGGGVKGRPATESRRRREDGGHFVWVCCSAAAAGSRGSGAWRWVGQGS